jgi:hypothetical protein
LENSAEFQKHPLDSLPSCQIWNIRRHRLSLVKLLHFFDRLMLPHRAPEVTFPKKELHLLTFPDRPPEAYRLPFELSLCFFVLFSLIE